MARLPIPGGDTGNWGQILNDFLSQAHDSTGYIKNGAVSNASIATASISEAKLDAAVQAKLNAVGGPAGATGATGMAGARELLETLVYKALKARLAQLVHKEQLERLYSHDKWGMELYLTSFLPWLNRRYGSGNLPNWRETYGHGCYQRSDV